jgi:SHS2 domain-containing protein
MQMTSVNYEEVDHTADWALRVRGRNLAQLLASAAQGMLELVGATPRAGETSRRKVRLEAADREALLVTWLEELLFPMELHGITYTAIDVQAADDTSLVAEVVEAPSAPLRKHIKAVTYHNLKIDETADGLEATLVFDV